VNLGLRRGYGACYWPPLDALDLDVCVCSPVGIRFIIAPGVGILSARSMLKPVELFRILLGFFVIL